MPSRIDRLKAWYADPARASLRGEVAWSWAWLTRERGWMWVLLYVAVDRGMRILYSTWLRGNYVEGDPPSAYRGLWVPTAALVITSAPGAIVWLYCWINAIRARSFSLIDRHSIGEAMPNRMGLATWISLVTAPFIIATFLGVADRFAYDVWHAGRWGLSGLGLLDSGTKFGFNWPNFAFWTPLNLIYDLPYQLGLATFVIAFAFPQGKIRAILMALFLVFVVQSVGAIGTVQVSFWIMDHFDLAPSPGSESEWRRYLALGAPIYTFKIVYTLALCWGGYVWLARRWARMIPEDGNGPPDSA